MRSPREGVDSLIHDMEAIPIPGAEIYYEKNFLNPQEASMLVLEDNEDDEVERGVLLGAKGR